MLCLAEAPMHGYALMQRVKEISQGAVLLGAGTLYTIFSTLEKEGLIQMVSEMDRRKTYALTPKGEQVLRKQIERLELMVENSHKMAANLRK